MTTPPIDRGRLEILSGAECWTLIAGEPVGRIAFVDGGRPAVLPVNHLRDGDTILFATGHGGRLTSEAIDGPVAFEVDGYDDEQRTGWSVLVHGTAEQLSTADAIERLDALGHSPRGDVAQAARWVRVHARHVSGRRIPDRAN